jgi:hypothetical protein
MNALICTLSNKIRSCNVKCCRQFVARRHMIYSDHSGNTKVMEQSFESLAGWISNGGWWIEWVHISIEKEYGFLDQGMCTIFLNLYTFLLWKQALFLIGNMIVFIRRKIRDSSKACHVVRNLKQFITLHTYFLEHVSIIYC